MTTTSGKVYRPSKFQKAWRIWAHAIGSKTGNDDLDADRIAVVRTILVVSSMVIGIFNAFVGVVIVLGIIHHW